MKEVYVLGAGASKACGGPLTAELLPQAFRHRAKIDQDGRIAMVEGFLRDFFAMDFSQGFENGRYPAIGEVLSLIDFALADKLGLGPRFNGDYLRHMRQSIEFLVFAILDHKLKHLTNGNLTPSFAGKLPDDSTIISLNYDIIIDKALDGGRWNERGINYGIEFGNCSSEPGLTPRLYKLHGSLNWLFCPTCNLIYFGGMKKVIRNIYEPREIYVRRAVCQRDGTALDPVLITPTALKERPYVQLSYLWLLAEEEVRKAGKVVFIGYSLPAEDIHMKYLFKRALTNNEYGDQLEIHVVNKTQARESRTLHRYQRLFGPKVKYFGGGFRDYVENQM